MTFAAGLLASAPARAASNDAPVTTSASAAAAGDEVDRQIDAWVAASPLSAADLATPGTGAPPEPRRVHGEVSATFGSHGYRDLSGVAEIPFARTGVATLAVRDAQSDLYGHQHLQSLALGISLGDAGRSGRGSVCGAAGRFDSPLWARRLQANGYGEGENCPADRADRRLR